MKIIIPQYVKVLMQSLEEAGYEAYLVGGCVRDSLLSLTINDYDIATSALPAQTAAVFADMTVIPTGIKHGTVTVLSQGNPVEITTYRVDGSYNDCRRPDSVTFTSSIRDDLSRRDFTVNAIAYSLCGDIIDPFDGMRDIEKRIIRAVGEPRKRFEEDALRILRALRFSSALSFAIEPDTAAAVMDCRALLYRISAERTAKELDGIVCSVNCADVLERFADVFYTFIPELDRGAYENSVMYKRLGISENALNSRLSALLAYTPAAEILRRLKYSNDIRHEVSYAAAHIGILPQNEDETADMLVSEGCRRLCDTILLTKLDAIARGDSITADKAEQALKCTERLYNTQRCFELKTLNIKGGDIVALGAHDAQIKTVLAALLKEASRGNVANEKNALIELSGRILQNLT